MAWHDEDLVDGPVPKWHQIAELLRSCITAGEFAPGDALPSETLLTRQFGISRTTARSALNELEHDQLVSRRSGQGTIVLPPKVEQPLNLLASFSDDMRARGLTPGYRLSEVSVASAPAEVAKELGLSEDEQVVHIDRVLLADGEPIASSASWLSPRVVATDNAPAPETLDASSLYQWIERETGTRISSGEEYIEGAVADPKLARRLAVPKGAPILIARRRCVSASGEPVESAVITYRADRYRFRIELARP
ncbi:GntR family transcriptional regulator [Sciscionella marina]|uniref:GntR family transcriptional regulator n=1 Tax=Sciscionella marina TaxID=508770 RepID=UPI00037992DA|nr:GntR family transcriptional regulator [Sciscionella marina]